jgi:hypothetical protein
MSNITVTVEQGKGIKVHNEGMDDNDMLNAIHSLIRAYRSQGNDASQHAIDAVLKELPKEALEAMGDVDEMLAGFAEFHKRHRIHGLRDMLDSAMQIPVDEDKSLKVEPEIDDLNEFIKKFKKE